MTTPKDGIHPSSTGFKPGEKAAAAAVKPGEPPAKAKSVADIFYPEKLGLRGAKP